MKAASGNRPVGNKTAASGIRSQLSIFLFFVIVSSSVWLVLKLSSQLTGTVGCDLEYINPPASAILIYSSHTAVTMELETAGYDMVRYKLWQKRPQLQVDLSGLPLQKDGETFFCNIPAASLIRAITQQFTPGTKIQHISPDSLSFRFAVEYKKQLPAIPDIEYKMRPQFSLYHPIVNSPDSVWIFGVQSDLQQINSLKTAKAALTDVYYNQTLTLPVEKPKTDYPVRLSPDMVEIRLRVEKYTEATVELPVVVVCDDKDYSVRVFPGSVKVTYLVALIDFKRVDASMFKAVVSCDGAQAHAAAKLKVDIAFSPEFVQITRIEPDRVEYIKVKN